MRNREDYLYEYDNDGMVCRHEVEVRDYPCQEPQSEDTMKDSGTLRMCNGSMSVIGPD